MAAIGATQLVMGFLTLLENQVEQVQVIPGVNLIKAGKQQLDRTMTGVTYALSQQQNFFIIFDADYENRAVVQKTYWGNDTNMIYEMVKKNAVAGKSYPGSDGFFIYSPQVGYILIEKQILEGRQCITASVEFVL